MTAAARADAKENSIAGVKPTKQAVIASHTRDHRAPTAALLKSPVGGWRWIVKIARASLRMREDRNPLDRLAGSQALKRVGETDISEKWRPGFVPSRQSLDHPGRRRRGYCAHPLRESELWTWDTPPGRGSHGFSNLGGGS
jgi:hypothetical protein